MSPEIQLPSVISQPFSAGGEIRRASAGDLPGLVVLYAQMHEEKPVEQPHGLERVFEEISALPGRALLVATLAGRLVGTLDLFVNANLTRGGRPWAGIENLVVDLGHRRQGVGGALVDVAVELARQADCYKVQLVSHQRRDAAHALYVRSGFDAPVQGYRRYI
jgi:GNAT superfamily N-acetyltransferase